MSSEANSSMIDGEWEFIWGITSFDNETGQEASLFSMNDILIKYNRNKKKYYLEVETIFNFNDRENGPKRYVSDLCDKMAEWMVKKGYGIGYKPSLSEVFFDYKGANHGFNSVEELYGVFRLLVDGFKSEPTISKKNEAKVQISCTEKRPDLSDLRGKNLFAEDYNYKAARGTCI